MDNKAYTGDGGVQINSVRPLSDENKLPEVLNSLPKASAIEVNSAPEGKGNEANVAQYEKVQYSAEKKDLDVLDDGSAKVDMPVVQATKPYAGMGKEDLLRFSQTPFWNRFRLACTIIFWLTWVGLIASVIALTITFPKCKPPPAQPWYKTSMFYEIYVRSFYDNDGDGIGDINGIRSKLDYLADLNTDAIILSSVYESHGEPADYGYEVTNHTSIDQEYGTDEDFDALLEEAHEMGIKVIMDFIPNHTGTGHPWFVESSNSRSRDNPYWNYYVWQDCTTTNNWVSVFGEPMWKENGTRGSGFPQCYLHQFLESQADLNLRSDAVKRELEKILRYWLDRGVDGFRVVKVKHLFEDHDMTDEPRSGECTDVNATSYHCYDHIYTTSLDEIYPLVEQWRAILDEYSEQTEEPRVLLTDAIDTIDNSVMYYGKYGDYGAHLPLNYKLTEIKESCDGKCAYELIDSWLYGMPTYGTADWTTGSHDLSRFANVVPSSLYNAMTILKMTLPGAAIVYYGEEIGMVNVNKTIPPKDPAGIIDISHSRDLYRTPMQWTMEEDHAGFINTSAENHVNKPWLAVGDNLYNISVEAQNSTQYAPYEFFREISHLRKTSETFYVGSFHWALLTKNVVSFFREYQGKDRYVVAVNFGAQTETVNIASSYYGIKNQKSADVVMTTSDDMSLAPGDTANLKALELRPGDGIIVKWEYQRPDGKVGTY